MRGVIPREIVKESERVVAAAERPDTVSTTGGAQGQGPDRRRTLAELAALEPEGPPLSPIIVSGGVRAFDAFMIFAAGAIARLLVGEIDWSWREMLLVIAPLITIAALDAAQLYSVPALRRGLRQLVHVLVAWTLILTLLFGTILLFSQTEGAPLALWGFAWWAIGAVAFVVERTVLRAMVRHWMRSGRLLRRTAIVGGGPAGAAVIDALAADRSSDVLLCGVFDDRQDDRSPDTVAGLPKLGTVDDLVDYARRSRLDLIVFTIPISAEARILEMLKKIAVLPVDVRLAAHTNRLQLRPRAYSYLGNVPVIDVHDRPIADWDVVLKWLFDRVVGALLLLALSPVMVATAIAIKLDSRGPVFFRQKRYGFNNELIEVFKFRSMYVDQCDATASKLVTKGDPRVTRVGRFIRKTSLDELPQLLNVVWKGNLSLVGPRPHALHAKAENRLYDEVVDGYFARHRVKPGITGWAQINGWRGETDTEDKIQNRVEHDLYYIENWSVLFDLAILVKTPFALLKTESAY